LEQFGDLGNGAFLGRSRAIFIPAVKCLYISQIYGMHIFTKKQSSDKVKQQNKFVEDELLALSVWVRTDMEHAVSCPLLGLKVFSPQGFQHREIAAS
jgi:hypothetical protein